MNTQEQKFIEKVNLKEFEAKLIMELKSHICLYAKDSPEYSNKQKRQDAWEDISTILGKTVQECQKKWTSLRDSFRSYYRLENNTPSGSGATSKIKWMHFKSLKFLIPYVKVPADDCGNFNENLGESSSRSQDENEVDVVGDEDSPCTTSNQQMPRAKKRKTKAITEEEPLERVLSAIENCDKQKPMQMFFDSVAQQVEHLSQRWQIRFQTKVLCLLAEELESADGD